MAKIIIRRQQATAQYYTEELGDGVGLDMILIPPGQFTMGAENEEMLRDKDEIPPHEVIISKPFFMSRYPITQAQWRVVAKLPRAEKELLLEPSHFQGSDKLPVDSVSWYEAIEFCARLSRYTKRNYRLPSEAEWEYACRAGTKTPFHYGETISSDVANYKADEIYGQGVEGEYRRRTTEVDFFNDAANKFGLNDMHGNVREWCADPWHKNYVDAPKDGSVWDREKDRDFYQNYLKNIHDLLNDRRDRIIRGGSWFKKPKSCCCGYRHYTLPDANYNEHGLRVVCDYE